MSGYCAFATMDKEELRALSRRAGVASGAARRAKRAAIEHERVTNAAMMAQEKRNQEQHQANIRFLRDMTKLILDMELHSG